MLNEASKNSQTQSKRPTTKQKGAYQKLISAFFCKMLLEVIINGSSVNSIALCTIS
jgi:hypothetical protein